MRVPLTTSVRAHRRAWRVLAPVAVLAIVPAATGAIPPTGALDLGEPGVAVSLGGVSPADQAGASVAAVGDVNGDGVGDLVIGAPGASPRGRQGAGSAHVVYGARPFATPTLSAPGPRGFRIDGGASGDSAGRSVSSAGDVNRDGLADILIGAVGVDETATVTDVGAAYVIYGQAAGGDVDLSAVGSRGIRVLGANMEDQFGSSVAAVGDVNGDTRGDLLIGASGVDAQGRSEAGAAYVIFGPAAAPVSLDAGSLPTAAGIRIDGPSSESTAGVRVAAAGDVNGDGRPDIAIGAPFADASAVKVGSGAVFVVLGRMGMTAGIDLAAVSATTMRFDGPAAGDGIGSAFATGGDLNGDGRAEILIGMPRADPLGRTDAGEVVAVRGSAPATPPTAVDLGAAGEVILRVQGAAAGDRLGQAVASPVDVTGDGKADLPLGAPGSANGARPAAGAGVLVTSLATATVDLAAPAAGLRIGGAETGDETGNALAAADLSGDGTVDLAIAAPSADPSGRSSAGQVAVLLGDAAAATPGPVRDPAKPDTAGVPKPFVLKSGPGLLIGSRTVSRTALVKAGCLRLRLQSSAVATATVSVQRTGKLARSARAARPLALKSAPFLTPGFRPVCLKLAVPRVGSLRVVLRMRVGATRTSATQLITVAK